MQCDVTDQQPSIKQADHTTCASDAGRMPAVPARCEAWPAQANITRGLQRHLHCCEQEQWMLSSRPAVQQTKPQRQPEVGCPSLCRQHHWQRPLLQVLQWRGN